MLKVNKTLLISILLSTCFSGVVFAQGNNLVLTAPPPPIVSNITATPTSTNTFGNSTLFYWVVAHYPIGNSQIAGPISVSNQNTGAANTVVVGWSNPTGSTTCDILRTTTSMPSSFTGNFLVTNTNCSNQTATDTLNVAPGAYTPSSISGWISNSTLNNYGFAQPRVQNDTTWMFPRICFNDLSCQTSAAPGGTLTTQGDVVCTSVTLGIDDCGTETTVNLLSTAGGTVNIGNPAGTGNITLGASTQPQTVNIADGATNTQTINMGNTTSGASNFNFGGRGLGGGGGTFQIYHNGPTATSTFSVCPSCPNTFNGRMGFLATGGGILSFFTGTTGAGLNDTVNMLTGNAAATAAKTFNLLTGTPGTSGNNKFKTGNGVTTLATFNAKTSTYLDWNFVLAAQETGAANALAVALTDSNGTNITQQTGLCFTVQLAHTLQAGANTIALNGAGAANLKSSRNAANNIATAYAVTGIIHVCFDGTNYLDMSQ